MEGRGKLEVVLNRYNSRNSDIDEKSATKALGHAVNWRVPNSYAAARGAQDSGVPLAEENSAIALAVVEMAKAACGKPLSVAKKVRKGFSFFGSKSQSEPAGA
jgi:Flp pilus assembly CpaE family ATPase